MAVQGINLRAILAKRSFAEKFSGRPFSKGRDLGDFLKVAVYVPKARRYA